MSAYEEFLARKAITDPMTGLGEIPDLPDALFPFQADITRWALKRGRAAIFAGTGLGKSFMELSWGQAVAAHTGRPVLHDLTAWNAELGGFPDHLRRNGKRREV